MIGSTRGVRLRTLTVHVGWLPSRGESPKKEPADAGSKGVRGGFAWPAYERTPKCAVRGRTRMFNDPAERILTPLKATTRRKLAHHSTMTHGRV